MSTELTTDIENPAELRHYLQRTGRMATDAGAVIRVLAGGVSCKTVRVEFAGGSTWVLKQALARLRVRADWFSDPARIHREAAGLRWLAKLAPIGTTVEFLFEDFSEHILAMTAVLEPHENWKVNLLARGPQSDHAEQFGRLLGTIHRRAMEHREALRAEFGDLTYFDELRLDAYYRATAAKLPAVADFYSRLVADTLANRVTLVHGDFSPKNVLIATGRLVLLDHEVVHWGDPAFDLGFALTHLLAKARHLPAHRAVLAAAAAGFWSAYRSEIGDCFPGIEARAVRHALGCLLARVDGRSPLEYLTAPERDALRSVVLAQLPTAPESVEDLISVISTATP